MDLLIKALPLLVVLIAALTDILWQRVPNWLTFPAVVCGPIAHGVASGWDGAVFSLAGLFSGFGLLIVFYALGGMAAGDVKLLAAVGAWIGAKPVFYVFLVSSIAGGAYALVLWLGGSLRREGASGTVRNVSTAVKSVLLTGEVQAVLPKRDASPKLRYAVCIALGTFVAQLCFDGGAATALRPFVHA